VNETSNHISQPLIHLKGVVKRYSVGPTHVEALASLDLSIAGGGLTAVVGPSGSGKSTLLHVIGGMDRADEGEVLVAGESLHHLNPSGLTVFRRHKVGFVFQAFNLMPNLTALENVVLPAEFAGTPTGEARGCAVELLQRVGLDGRLRHRPGQLSGGEQQRVAIARALINRPALVLADEPTGNLDSKTGAAIVDLLASLADEQTVLVATHDERINRVAKRVIYVSDGQVVQNEDRDVIRA